MSKLSPNVVALFEDYLHRIGACNTLLDKCVSPVEYELIDAQRRDLVDKADKLAKGDLDEPRRVFGPLFGRVPQGRPAEGAVCPASSAA